VVLFLGVALEGEAFLLGGAFLAHRGTFHLLTVIIVALAANCVADQVYYMVARARGRNWLERRFGRHPRYRRILELMGQHGNWLLLLSRYAFGFRIIIPAACGALGMPARRFTIINLMAGTIWACQGLLGFYLGQAADLVLQTAHRYEFRILLIFLLAAVLILAVRHLHRQNFSRT
jgi:membrane protein DedA with SNARE-associated domain